MNSHLTHTMAFERSAELHRAGERARLAAVARSEPEPQRRRNRIARVRARMARVTARIAPTS